MLREVTAVKSEPGGAHKQWFSDEAMDLFVWRNEAKQIQKFQLTYKLTQTTEEYALTWNAAEGFVFHLVDDGEERHDRHKATPILLPTDHLPLREAAEMFSLRSQSLNPGLRAFVQGRLDNALG